MRGVSKLPALIARGFSSTSSAIRPAKGGLSGEAVVRTSRVPDGPGLAYFVESHSRKGGEQGLLPQGQNRNHLLFACPCHRRCLEVPTLDQNDDTYAVLALPFAAYAESNPKSANKQLSLYSASRINSLTKHVMSWSAPSTRDPRQASLTPTPPAPRLAPTLFSCYTRIPVGLRHRLVRCFVPMAPSYDFWPGWRSCFTGMTINFGHARTFLNTGCYSQAVTAVRGLRLVFSPFFSVSIQSSGPEFSPALWVILQCIPSGVPCSPVVFLISEKSTLPGHRRGRRHTSSPRPLASTFYRTQLYVWQLYDTWYGFVPGTYATYYMCRPFGLRLIQRSMNDQANRTF